MFKIPFRRVFITPQDLATGFEILGENCEAGIVQRLLGAEPLGLFRFASSSLANLVHVIETEGRHLYTAEDVEIETTSEGEYLLRSRRYGDFLIHSFVHENDVGLYDFRAKRLFVLDYLKTRFFDDMRTGDKIFVRQGVEDLDGLARLQRALSRHRPRVLLNVAQADAFHPPGIVERIGPGLWRGYISYFKRFTTPEPLDLPHWLAVLSSASRHLARGRRCAPNRVLGSIASWAAAAGGAEASRSDARSPDGGTGSAFVAVNDVVGDRLLASLEIALDLAVDTMVVFAVPVWLDGTYEGFPLRLTLENAAELHSATADPARRGCWQCAFVAAKIASRQKMVTLGARAAARAGSRFVLGPATIESGVVPAASDHRRAGPSLARRVQRRFVSAADDLRLRRGRITVAELASKAIAEGAFVAADDLLSEALVQSPDDPILRKLYATSAHNGARYNAAIRRWRAAADVAPDDPMCLAGIACNFRELNVLDPAASIITTGLVRFPDDATILTEAARIAAARREWTAAASLYDKAIALHGARAPWVEAREQAAMMSELRELLEASPGIEPGCKDLQSSA